MALGAHFDMQVIAIGGVGGKGITTTADDLDRFIIRVYFRLHWVMLGSLTAFFQGGEFNPNPNE
jgi:hypothetical protein